MREVKTNGDLQNGLASPTKSNSIWQRIGIYAAVLLVVFLLGLVPMWLSAREATSQRDAAQASLRLSHLQTRLATAAINARRGEYELARTTLSDFFTELRAEVARPAAESALTKSQRTAAKPILEQRDELITLLARSDPAAADRLSGLYLNYLQPPRTATGQQ